MTKRYEIKPTLVSELEFIYTLYDHAIRYQKQKGFPVWHGFDRSILVNDVKKNNHYKVLVESQVAIVFSVCYSDKVIWRHMERGDAIYLHRIAVNPAFKGLRLFSAIVDWTFEHAKQKELKFIRMDTWADNSLLVDYYKGFGFNFVENFTTPDSPELPFQNRNLSLALLERKL